MKSNAALEILPGSEPGKIRLRGTPELVQKWKPVIAADREKIRASIQKGDELAALVLAVAHAFDCPPEEISLLLNMAARDPFGMRRSFEIMAKERGLGIALRNFE